MRSEQRQAEHDAIHIQWLENELHRQANLLSIRTDDWYRALRERDEARQQLFGLLTGKGQA